MKAPEEATTAERPKAPNEASLEFLPNGGLLHLRFGDTPCAVFLPQRRADLVAALLSPLNGVAAGAWVDDEVLMRRVWSREGASRVQLNVLVHRVRESLTQAGVNGPALIQRVPGGGAVRFQLAAGARCPCADREVVSQRGPPWPLRRSPGAVAQYLQSAVEM